MKKYTKIFLIISSIVAIGMCFTGCKKEKINTKTDTKGNYKIYYPNKSLTKILSDSVVIKEKDTDAIVNELIISLKQGNYSESNVAVIPQEIEYATYTQEANILTLTFDENYNELSGIEEVLTRASIVYTMLQIKNIDYVRIQVNGQPLVIDNSEVGDMSKETFMDFIGKDFECNITDKIKMYYSDSTGKKLRVLETNITTDGTLRKEEVVIRKLIAGPKGTEKVGYYASINPETVLNRVAINDKVCYVDFNESFLERRNGVSEQVAVYSLVNTLTELTSVNQVRITINGANVSTYADKVKIDGFIEKNYDIISYEE